LERLRRESFLEAVGYDPSSVREMRELVEVLRSQVEMLRTELDEAHAANRENRRIIAALTQRREAPEGVLERLERAEPRSSGEVQEGSERPPDTAEWPVHGGLIRPWWRRMFSG
jgi:chromosome segregation ATPase